MTNSRLRAVARLLFWLFAFIGIFFRGNASKDFGKLYEEVFKSSTIVPFVISGLTIFLIASLFKLGRFRPIAQQILKEEIFNVLYTGLSVAAASALGLTALSLFGRSAPTFWHLILVADLVTLILLLVIVPWVEDWFERRRAATKPPLDKQKATT